MVKGKRSGYVKFFSKQSGFTPDKSATDRIPALCVLVERRRESRQGMLLQPMSISRRRLTLCIERHSGIFCVSVGFL